LRLRIVFTLHNRGAYVPFHHQFLLAQVIKGLVVTGGHARFAHYTQFNFSGLKGQTKVSRKGLHFYSSRVTLVFSASDHEFVEYLKTVLFAQKELLVGSLLLSPESVETEPPLAFTEAMKFLCISPLVVLPPAFNNDHGKRFIPPASDEFSDLLYAHTLSRMEAAGVFSAAQLAGFYRFQIVPDRDYLQRMQANQKKFSRIFPLFDADVKYEVRGYTFPFTLFAPVPVQQFVYENGLGHSCHKGFGMLDAAQPDAVQQAADAALDYA
jgi:CRISPR-associated endoribonuclease Cas6